jgi:hypothetical protein
LVLGHHPELQGHRALARRKGNAGRVPPALTFTIEPATVVNPDTGEVVEVGTVSSPVEDPDLRWEDVRFAPPQEPGESKGDVMKRVLCELGSDGERRRRADAKETCLAAGVSVGTFEREWPHLVGDVIDTEKDGREVWWRLKSRKENQ